jgi:hypothetical protein
MYNKYAMESHDEVLDKLEKVIKTNVDGLIEKGGDIIEGNVELLIVKAEEVALAEAKAATQKVVDVVNSEKAACYSWLFELLRTFRRKTQPVLATSSETEKKVST